MSLFDTFKKKAGEAVDQHGDKIAQGLDRASGAVSKATKGKYADTVDKGVGLAKKPLSKTEAGPAGPGTGGTGPGTDPIEPVVVAAPDEPVVDVAPVDPAEPTSTTGSLDSDDPADGTSATGSPSTKP